MAGEYRRPEVLAKLPAKLRKLIEDGDLRLARTDVPIRGATNLHELKEEVAEAYARIGMNDIAEKIRDGSIVPIRPRGENMGPGYIQDRYWRPGELFLVS